MGAEARLGAVYRLAVMREHYRELSRAAQEAHNDLAAAIMAMDEAAGIEGRHNLQEQAAVEAAKNAHAQALANLLRGEEPSDDR